MYGPGLPLNRDHSGVLHTCYIHPTDMLQEDCRLSSAACSFEPREAKRLLKAATALWTWDMKYWREEF
jgi:hypothetical protein